VEFGTHDSLIDKNGLYSNLVNLQMRQEDGKYDEEDSLESDEDMKKYKSSVTPSTSRTIQRQISTKVKYNEYYYYYIYIYFLLNVVLY